MGDVTAVNADPNIYTFDLAWGTKYARHGIRVDVIIAGVEGNGLYEFGFGFGGWIVEHKTFDGIIAN